MKVRLRFAVLMGLLISAPAILLMHYARVIIDEQENRRLNTPIEEKVDNRDLIISLTKKINIVTYYTSIVLLFLFFVFIYYLIKWFIDKYKKATGKEILNITEIAMIEKEINEQLSNARIYDFSVRKRLKRATEIYLDKKEKFKK